MGFVFGYPDKTFKPTEAITHSEATSVIANISKTSMNDKSILEQFSDSGEIPVWALDSYAKSRYRESLCKSPRTHQDSAQIQK